MFEWLKKTTTTTMTITKLYCGSRWIVQIYWERLNSWAKLQKCRELTHSSGHSMFFCVCASCSFLVTYLTTVSINNTSLHLISISSKMFFKLEYGILRMPWYLQSMQGIYSSKIPVNSSVYPSKIPGHKLQQTYVLHILWVHNKIPTVQAIV